MKFSTILTLASTLITSSLATSPITTNGNTFFDESGSRFYIRGVAYIINLSKWLQGDPERRYRGAIAEIMKLLKPIKNIEEYIKYLRTLFNCDTKSPSGAVVMLLNRLDENEKDLLNLLKVQSGLPGLIKIMKQVIRTQTDTTIRDKIIKPVQTDSNMTHIDALNYVDKKKDR